MRSSTEESEATVPDETSSLLSSPANAERLLAAIERARRGDFEQHDLVDS